MWVPACMVYLTVMLATLARWYRAPEQDDFSPSLAMQSVTGRGAEIGVIDAK
jgi:hypothetical protein